MLVASNREGELLRALKWALTGTELLIVSVNGIIRSLTQMLKGFNPIFSSEEIIEAAYFTSKIFDDVEVLIDDEPFQQVEPDNPLMASSNLASLVANLANLREDLTADAEEDDEEDDCKNQQLDARENESNNQSRESEEGNRNSMDETGNCNENSEQEVNG